MLGQTEFLMASVLSLLLYLTKKFSPSDGDCTHKIRVDSFVKEIKPNVSKSIDHNLHYLIPYGILNTDLRFWFCLSDIWKTNESKYTSSEVVSLQYCIVIMHGAFQGIVWKHSWADCQDGDALLDEEQLKIRMARLWMPNPLMKLA